MRTLEFKIKEIENGYIVGTESNSSSFGETYCETEQAVERHVGLMIEKFCNKDDSGN